MARRSNMPRRRRWGAAAAGLVVAAAVAGCAPQVSSGPGEVGTSNGEQVIVCTSEVVDDNGVKTSSSVAARVPAGTPVPPGCRLA